MPDLSDTDIHLEFVFEDNIVIKGTINRIYAPLVVEEMHTYSQVNILGKIITDEDYISKLKKVRRGSLVEIRAVY